MSRHLKTCLKRAEYLERREVKDGQQAKQYVISITDRYVKTFWLYVGIEMEATLEDLDRFIRAVWVECCGHLSSFHIDGEGYNSVVDSMWGYSENDMNIKLKDVLIVGEKFTYEYDFGSTTLLELKAIDTCLGPKRKNHAEIMARNLAYEKNCDECGNSASAFCQDCEQYLCAECCEIHTCDDFALVTMSNSPRDGVCGYVGSVDDEKPYLPFE